MLQAKKRFWGKRPGFDTGDILHIGANVMFVAIIYAMIMQWELSLLAIILILLSKWRVLAVQPRFWAPNIKANLVDIIVGVSTVILIGEASHAWLSLFWALLYIAWLLFLKPREHDVLVGVQALWAQLVGMVAIFMLPDLVAMPLLVCALVWVIAWSAARHFFSNYEESHYRTLGMVWGFLIMQLAWISLHWVQYYIVFDMQIVVIAVIVALLSSSGGSIYHAYKKDTLHRGVVVENMLFAGALLIVILATAGWSPRL